MFKTKKARIVLAAAAVLLLCLFLVPHLLNADTYRGRIETVLSDSLGRPVHLGHLKFSLFSGSLVAETPSIADDPAFSSEPFLTAKDVRIGVEVWPLLMSHQLHITGLTIDEPRITLLRAENGTWNYSSIGREGKRKAPTAATQNMMPNLSVGKLEIADGTVAVGTAPQTGALRTYTNLHLDVKNFSFTQQFPFTLDGKLPAGGTLHMDGTAGPINQHDASLTAVSANVALKQANLVAAGMVTPAQGISGIADLNCTVLSNGQTLTAEGTLNLTQLKLAQNGTPSPKPVDTRFAIEQNLQSLTGTVRRADIQIGRAQVTITGNYQRRGNTTTLNSNVDGSEMPIDDLVAFLPSMGMQLPSGSHLQGGTLTTKLNVSGPLTGIIISGPVHIANTQLAGFDLGQKLAAIQSLTGAKTGSNTTIQTLSTDLRYGPEGTETSNLLVVVPGLGSASGAGSISPAGALDYHLIAKLASSGVGGLAMQAMSLIPGAFGSAVGQTTRIGIPVTISGTTANPTFTPDMGKVFGGSTKQGPAQSNPIGSLLGGLMPH